jgi:hypothetical protein
MMTKLKAALAGWGRFFAPANKWTLGISLLVLAAGMFQIFIGPNTVSRLLGGLSAFCAGTTFALAITIPHLEGMRQFIEDHLYDEHMIAQRLADETQDMLKRRGHQVGVHGWPPGTDAPDTNKPTRH